nr:ubiquitin-like modifier-activating enzyme atg7 [Tanacetum cinerariifolium]
MYYLNLKSLYCDSLERNCGDDIGIKGENFKKEVTEAGNDSDEAKSESIMRLSWALVHSMKPKQRMCNMIDGIAMLEGFYAPCSNPQVFIHLILLGEALPTEPSDDPLTETSRGNKNKCYAPATLYCMG